MKKYIYLKGLLGATVVGLSVAPLCLSTASIKQSNLQTKNIKSINDVKTKEWIPIPNASNGCDWEVEFDHEKKTSAICGWRQNANIRVVKIPSYFTPAGSTERYPLVTVWPGHFDNLNNNREVLLLDFSEAKNVTYIGGFYNEEKKLRSVHVKSVKFAGATSLEKIDKDAFAWQKIDRNYANNKFKDEPQNQVKDFDFSGTKLNFIGENAFKQCCDNTNDSARRFSQLIFPSTIRKISQDAFDWYQKNKRCLKFDNICFPPPASEIKDNAFFADGANFPELSNSESNKCICVPTQEQLDAIKKCSHAIQKEKGMSNDTYFKSEVKFSKTGSPTLYGNYGNSGKDKNPWTVLMQNDMPIPAQYEFGVSLSNDYDGQIYLTQTETNDLGWNVGWKNTLKPGKYTFAIKFFARDTKTNRAPRSIIISEPITLYVNEYSMSGGTAYNVVKTNAEYTDPKTWKLNARADEEYTEPNIIKDVEYSVETPSTFAGTIKAITTPVEKWYKKEAQIYIDLRGHAYTSGKTFQFNLVSKVIFEDSSYIFVHTPVFAIVDNGEYSAKIYQKDGTTEISTDQGIWIDSTSPTTTECVVKFHSSEPMDEETQQVVIGSARASYLNGGAINIDTPKVSGDQKEIEFHVSIKTGTTAETLTKGVYYIYFHFVTPTDNLPVYTPVVPIKVGTSDSEMKQFTLADGSDNLYAYKKTVDRDYYDWTLKMPDTYKRNKFDFIPTSWVKETERAEHIKIKDVNEAENKFFVFWDDQFCTNSDWVDIYDCNLQLMLQSTQSDDEVVFVKPITINSFNYSSVQTNTPRYIKAQNTKAGSVTSPWLLVVNDDQTVNDKETTFEIDSSLSSDQLWLKPVEGTVNQVYLEWSGTIPKGYYPFSITAYSDNYFTSATSELYFLCVENKLEIVDLPQIIKTKQGDTGAIEKPLSTYLNDVKTDLATYTLINPPSGVTIDAKSGVISWDGKTIPGTHDLIVQATVDTGTGDPDIVTKTIPMIVEASGWGGIDGPTIGIIVGSMVGAAGVGVAGTFGGQAIARKIKAKKTK